MFVWTNVHMYKCLSGHIFICSNVRLDTCSSGLMFIYTDDCQDTCSSVPMSARTHVYLYKCLSGHISFCINVGLETYSLLKHVLTCLDTCSYRHMYVCTLELPSKWLKIFTSAHLHTLSSVNLDTCVSAHCSPGVFAHYLCVCTLYIIYVSAVCTLPVCLYTVHHLCVCSLHIVLQVCGRVPQGDVLPAHLLPPKQPTGG